MADLLTQPSPSNSAWNHFGRMGLIDATDTSVSYPYAFSLTLAYADNLSAVLKAPDDQRLHLPVNPEEITIPLQRGVSPMDTLSSAQVLHVGNLQLRQLSLSSFFPMAYDDEYCVPAPVTLTSTAARLDKLPRDAVAFIETSMQVSSPLYLHFYAGSAPINAAPSLPPALPCVVTGFAPRYIAGHPLDIYFDLELTEYRVPSFGTRFDSRQAPTYNIHKRGKNGKVTTVKGDTVLKIAAVIYGSTYKQVGAAQILNDSNKGKRRILDTKDKRARAGSVLKPKQVLIVARLRDDYINRSTAS